ncbi:hypothetical protein [Pelistega europaea]|uniref:Transposase n=1 Tax=Pelistega europaea TaxID=106147 RepID=A0A7Y4LAY7_9BURK|nr:hypothetical protein [Pelistega europaea]NOL50138.1 hypothetical protein [Pelistega europaea]
MARLARLYAPDTTQLVQARLLPHIAQQAEVQAMKPQIARWLEQASGHYRLPIHAWSMTQDSIYLLSTPREPRSISQVVQAIGRHLASSLKQGAVFASRYRSCLVESGDYLLACMIWLEIYVHQQEGISHPDRLPWSSAGMHTGRLYQDIAWITDHETYWRLGNTPFERQARYRQLCEDGLSHAMSYKIQSILQGQWALGTEEFIATMSEVASRRVMPGQKGRPRKEDNK